MPRDLPQEPGWHSNSIDDGPIPDSFLGVIDNVIALGNQNQVRIGEIVRSIGQVSFMPLLILPAIALASPLSGIPLFSATMGIFIILVTVQMILQRDHIWLPAWLLNLHSEGDRIATAFGYLRRPAIWLDKHSNRRWSALVSGPLIVIPQALCLASGLVLPFLEVVPFSSSLFGVAVALLAFGMFARDGVIVSLAVLPYVGVGWFISQLL